MRERFFFDGIDLQSGGRRIAKAVQLAAFIYADETKTGLTFTDVAVSRAEVAVDAILRDGLPPTGFVQCFGLLKNLQFLHGVPGDIRSLRASSRKEIIHPLRIRVLNPPGTLCLLLHVAALLCP